MLVAGVWLFFGRSFRLIGMDAIDFKSESTEEFQGVEG